MDLEFKLVKNDTDNNSSIKKHYESPEKRYNSDNLSWKASDEYVDVSECVEWFTCNSDDFDLDEEDLLNMLVKGVPLTDIDKETEFCDADMLEKILKSKMLVGQMPPNDLVRTRSRANPFETIKSVFFMNRAALKMANIDAATDFMFTDIDRSVRNRSQTGIYYFADVCAGPGGFSEYILWRKRWLFKGFGLTLRGQHDFKLSQSVCASDATFRSYYGASDDGDIYKPENISDFATKVRHETNGMGVHFMMSDGGFSVEGQEKIQEVLSKQIYVCQCLLALEIVREHGHFVTKMFDTYTRFTVGLIYLMYRCFEKFTVLKPKSSRPANSERYIIFYGKRNTAAIECIVKHLKYVVEHLARIKNQNIEDQDINEIISFETIKNDAAFTNFFTSCNNRIGNRQIASLLKLGLFYYNRNLVEVQQSVLRAECLKCWRIPDKPKEQFTSYSIQDLIMEACSKPEFLYVQPRCINSCEELAKILDEPSDWHYALMACDRHKTVCNIYAAIGGSRVFRLQKSKWVRIKHIKLVKGTLIYGEMVQEKCVDANGEETDIQSLHVIDAMRLGDISLADLPFTERVDLIQTYCLAVNFETVDGIRIRHKPMKCFSQFNNYTGNVGVLPTVGCTSTSETYNFHSILFLKSNQHNLFNTTYVLRAQLFVDPLDVISLDDVYEYVKNNSRMTIHCKKYSDE